MSKLTEHKNEMRTRRTAASIALAACALAICIGLPGTAWTGSVFMKNGYIIQGPIVERSDNVVILGWPQARWQNRSHFFGVSARMMRRTLVDIARRRFAHRRGGPHVIQVPIEHLDIAAREPDTDLVAIDRALERLAAEDIRKARVVELRFFGGLSMEETAQVLGISVRTAHSDWAFARAWLYRALTGEPCV